MITLSPRESLASGVLKLAVDSLTAPRDVAAGFGLLRLQSREGDTVVDNVDWPQNPNYQEIGRIMGESASRALQRTLWSIAPVLGFDLGKRDCRWRTRRPYAFWAVLDCDRYCPLCLRETPAFDLFWRLRPATICELHGVLLVDACPVCGTYTPLQTYLRRRQPLVRPRFFHNADGFLTFTWPSDTDVLRRCGQCGADLASAPVVPVGQETTNLFRPLFAALEGQPELMKGPLFEPREFLSVYYQVARILTTTARRGYGDYSCQRIFKDRAPRFVTSQTDGVFADVEDMHVLSCATLRVIERWSSAFAELASDVREHHDHDLLGIGEHYDLPRPMTTIIRSTAGLARRAMCEVEVARYAIGDKPLGRLSATEWLRVLSVLWEKDGPPPLAIVPGESQQRHAVFPPNAPLRDVLDDLLAAVEGDGATPQEYQSRDYAFGNFLASRATTTIFEHLMHELRSIAIERRLTQSGQLLLFADPECPSKGITDLAWLRIRPLLPRASVQERHNISGRSLPWRGLVEQVLVRLCSRNYYAASRQLTRGDIGFYTKLGHAGRPVIWRAVRALCGLAGETSEKTVLIERPIVSNDAWARGGLDEILAVQAKKRDPRQSFAIRRAFEVFVDSWFTSEALAAIEPMARNGVACRATVVRWVKEWTESGQLRRALRSLRAVEPMEVNRLLFEQVLQDLMPRP